MDASERWVGVDEVASHLGVAKDSVYRWIDERGLPAHRVGRLFRFKLSEIDDWVRRDDQRKNVSNPVQGRSFLKAQTNRSTRNIRLRKREDNG